MTSHPKYPHCVRRRQGSARQFAGLTLAALALSLASGFLTLPEWMEGDASMMSPHPSVELGAQDIEGWREVWSATGEQARLLVEPQSENRWVCPHIDGRARQPMCRRFDAELLGVCRQGKHFQLVLANGDIHRVDQALLDIGGSFTPVHHPDQALSLRVAWIPTRDCYPEAGSAAILAVDEASNLMHYDGQGWSKIDQLESLSGAFGVLE